MYIHTIKRRTKEALTVPADLDPQTYCERKHVVQHLVARVSWLGIAILVSI